MIRFLQTLIRILLFGNGSSFPSLLSGRADTLLRDGLPRMVAVVGDPGTGKTFYIADHLIEYKKKYPDEAIFILDWNGTLTDVIFQIVLSDPRRDWLLEQIVLDEVGHPQYVVPLPLFHPSYDTELTSEARVNQQVARVTQDFIKLNWRLVEQNPTLGGIPIKFMLPNFLKLINAISEGTGTNWQITEVRRLLRLPEPDKKKKENGSESNEKKENELMTALSKHGKRIPHLKEYFFEDYFPVPYREKELRTNALRSILTIIEANDIRAKVGYELPGWTPRDAIEKGQMVIIDTSRLIGREAEQTFVNRYIFSLILAEIKKRRSLNAGKLVHVVLDDSGGFFNNESISEELASLPVNFRVKRMILYLIFQNLGQLTSGTGMAPGLKENFFTIGNIAAFALSDFRDSFVMAEQFFSFNPASVKVPARTETQHDIMENRDEQKAIRAAQIQRMAHREFFIRRYLTENRRDPQVRHIARTRNVRITVTEREVASAKEAKIREHAVEMSAALAAIKRRKLINRPARPQEPDSV